MKRGITAIVAVVLLIALSVVAAISIYFWMSGLATKQPTPETPVSIVANPIGHGKVLIANLGQKPINTSSLRTSDPNLQIECKKGVINPGEQVLCTVKGNLSSCEITIWGSGTGSATIPVNPERIDNPPSIEWVKDNSTDGEILLGESLLVQAKVTDDVGVKNVTLTADNPSGSFEMQDIGNDIYVKDITPQVAGELNYFVTANDTSNQTAQSGSHTVKVIDTWLYGYGNGEITDSLETDDGYILVGTKDNNGLIMKVYKNGTVSWAKEYDIKNDDWFTSIVPAASITGDWAGCLVAGADNITGNSDAVLLLINPTNGDIITDKIFNYTNASSGINDLVNIANGRVIGVGFINGNAAIFGISIPTSTGIMVQWAKEYNVSSSFYTGYKTHDGYILAAGYSGDSGLVAKFDSDGNLIWQKKVVFTGPCIPEGFPMASTWDITELNGYYYVEGIGVCIPRPGTEPHILDPDILVLDSSGNLVDSKSIGIHSAVANTLEPYNNGLLLAGWDGNKITLVDLGSDLEINWAKNYTLDANATMVKGINDGIFMAGVSDSNIYLFKMNKTGIINDCQVNDTEISTDTSKLDVQDANGAFNDTSVDFASITPTVTEIQIQPSCVCQPFGC